MRKVKIIGSGRVVENLLLNHRDLLSNFDVEFYSRKPRLIANNVEAKDIDSFKSTDDIVILCSSVCEKALLKKCSSKSREKVFKSNIYHIDDYLKRGCFERGRIFVLTNPSELIAEYIFKKTANKNIFALGQEVDFKRYSKHLVIGKRSKCLGQHYQYPIIQNIKNNFNQFDLRLKLIKQVKSEFIGDSPPYESGTYNIVKLLESLRTNSNSKISSYCSIYDSFLCGILNTQCGKFKINKPTTKKEMVFIMEQVSTSKALIARYL